MDLRMPYVRGHAKRNPKPAVKSQKGFSSLNSLRKLLRSTLSRSEARGGVSVILLGAPRDIDAGAKLGAYEGARPNVGFLSLSL